MEGEVKEEEMRREETKIGEERDNNEGNREEEG